MNRGIREQANAAHPARSNELLGLPGDARVLIINADDFGMYPAVNTAVIRSIEEGIASSCSLMAPCPAAPHAMDLLRQHPRIPFGIHLTLARTYSLRVGLPLNFTNINNTWPIYPIMPTQIPEYGLAGVAQAHMNCDNYT